MADEKQTNEAAVGAATVQIIQIRRAECTFYIKGTEPLILNRMAEKAKRALLIGSTRKGEAEKAASQKHDPIQEYRDSAYRHVGDSGPTRLYLPSTAFKGVLCTAALDMPGAKKTQVGRLVWVKERSIDIYGVPQLSMMVVRSADIKRTPDIRTRAIVPSWACKVTINYATPFIKDATIANLLSAGGITCGVGDYRQEKGKGWYGQFEPTSEDDEEVLELIANGGREAQDRALATPVCFDAESEEMLNWYQAEMAARRSPKRVKLKEVA